MLIKRYTEIEPAHINHETATGITGRVVIGKKDGANNYCMRVFEIAPAGITTQHSHAWEHEIFVHSGKGEIFSDGRWHKIMSGTVVFVPENEVHQLRNTGKELLIVVNIIPSDAPEL